MHPERFRGRCFVISLRLRRSRSIRFHPLAIYRSPWFKPLQCYLGKLCNFGKLFTRRSALPPLVASMRFGQSGSAPFAFLPGFLFAWVLALVPFAASLMLPDKSSWRLGVFRPLRYVFCRFSGLSFALCLRASVVKSVLVAALPRCGLCPLR